MLTITVLGPELYNKETREFFTQGDVVLELEHSLVSLSKWELIYKKPFLSNDDKTREETIAYIKTMVLTPDVPEEVFTRLSQENIEDINTYITDPMTATTFRSDAKNRRSGTQVVTNELIYYWMVALNIPMECQNWHLNRLLTLIRVINEKNAPAKKMSRQEIAERNRQLNAERRAKYNSKG